MDFTLIIGISGATIILVAFFLNQAHKLSNDSWWYDFLNFIGATFLALYAYLIGGIPFMILNIIWGLVSLRDLVFKDRL